MPVSFATSLRCRHFRKMRIGLQISRKAAGAIQSAIWTVCIRTVAEGVPGGMGEPGDHAGPGK